MLVFMKMLNLKFEDDPPAADTAQSIVEESSASQASVLAPATDPAPDPALVAAKDSAPATTTAPATAPDAAAAEEPQFQYLNPLIVVQPGPNQGKNPHQMRLYGKIVGDGNCLFRSVAHALGDHQDLHQRYRQDALSYISANAAHFAQDIHRFHDGQAVEEYVRSMTPDRVYGDDLMIIALCLKLNVSITLYQTASAGNISSTRYAPSAPDPERRHLDIHLDLVREHYECYEPSPPAAEKVIFLFN